MIIFITGPGFMFGHWVLVVSQLHRNMLCLFVSVQYIVLLRSSSTEGSIGIA